MAACRGFHHAFANPRSFLGSFLLTRHGLCHFSARPVRILLRHARGCSSVPKLSWDGPSTFKSSDVKIELLRTRSEKPDFNNLVFGRHLSDHMLEIKWSSTEGWHTPEIYPMHPMTIHPAAKCLHYAVELFEGLKAFRGADNKIRLFRPEMNMKRMLSSAQRAFLPTFDGDELIECIKKLIDIDKEWVPDMSTGSTLYIRPTFIGTEPSLGVNNSLTASLFVLIGPVGPYFPTGLKPVKLLADPKFVRAFPGGCGDSKLGSNYGPTIYVAKIAEQAGCQQVLWLYGDERRLTEVGTMNIFMYWINSSGEKELVTPPLDGIVLPGVTRDSLLTLASEWGEFKISERNFTMKDVITGLREHRVKEIFGAGTACVVCPVNSILYKDGQAREELIIPTMTHKPSVFERLYNELTDIQFGKNPFRDWTKHELDG